MGVATSAGTSLRRTMALNASTIGASATLSLQREPDNSPTRYFRSARISVSPPTPAARSRSASSPVFVVMSRPNVEKLRASRSRRSINALIDTSR